MAAPQIIAVKQAIGSIPLVWLGADTFLAGPGGAGHEHGSARRNPLHRHQNVRLMLDWATH
jgi:hypothetical protein